MQRLGPAEQQVTARTEREEEVAEDPVLSLLTEVHERVARHQEVDARDRRILQEVVAAEDDRAAKAVAEGVVAVERDEVALAQLVGHVCNLFLGVCGLPRTAERVVVDVRRVDLGPLAERLLSQRLGEEDRDRVRLGARRAARRPDADLPVAVELIDEPRHDVAPRRTPTPPGRGRSR